MLISLSSLFFSRTHIQVYNCFNSTDTLIYSENAPKFTPLKHKILLYATRKTYIKWI